MLDRETVIRLAREAANSGDGSELSGDAIERFAQLVFLHAARQKPAKRQYYYKMSGCLALNPLDQKCICWHDEGTGPVPSMDPELLEWRDAPAGVRAVHGPSDGVVMAQALNALEHAQCGLRWYRDRYPEAADGSDDEVDEMIDAAVADLKLALKRADGVAMPGEGQQ